MEKQKRTGDIHLKEFNKNTYNYHIYNIPYITLQYIKEAFSIYNKDFICINKSKEYNNV